MHLIRTVFFVDLQPKIQKFNLKMNIKRRDIFKIFIPLFIMNFAFFGTAFSQATGSLFMLQDNFHSQILNPSYKRTDNAIIISIVGLAGSTVGNSGNFKFSDILVKDQTGKTGMDFKQFYDAGNTESSVVDWSSIPVVFVSIPLSEGRLSIYLKEQIQSSLNFNTTMQQFPDFGNITSYNTDNIDYSGMGYRELAVGYARDINENISIGIRGKILFGAVFIDVNDWSFGVNTTLNGDSLELTHKGPGRLMIPVTTKLDDNKIVRYMEGKNAVGKYLSSYHNPGLGIDLGATFTINEKSSLTVSTTDLGAIWFRHNTMDIEQNFSHVFDNPELNDYLESSNEGEYFNPYNLILKTKDEIPKLYRPQVDTAGFVQGLVPKTSLHYQYYFSERLSFGATNQSAFYKNNFLNILTVSGLQNRGNFSIFESVNLYGLKTVTVGAGIQYEGRFGQIFAAADNIFAVIQPTKNESFSFSVGISLLINKTAEKKISKGNFSPHFPFYENKK